MTDVTGLPVQGYKPTQPQEAIDQVNLNKQSEERLLRLCEMLMDTGLYNPRWISIARTHFEEGFMALNRAIFQPQRITLPEDLLSKDDDIPF